MLAKLQSSKEENDILFIGKSHNEIISKYESQIILMENNQIQMEEDMKQQQQNFSDIKSKEISQLNEELLLVKEQLHESEIKHLSVMENAKREIFDVKSAADIANKELLKTRDDAINLLQIEMNDLQLSAENARQQMAIKEESLDLRYKAFQKTLQEPKLQKSEAENIIAQLKLNSKENEEQYEAHYAGIIE